MTLIFFRPVANFFEATFKFTSDRLQQDPSSLMANEAFALGRSLGIPGALTSRSEVMIVWMMSTAALMHSNVLKMFWGPNSLNDIQKC